MMPLSFMRPDASPLFFKAKIESADDLALGRNAILDRICEGILSHEPFIYPAEELGLHDA
jgi:hypothetical protein